MSEMLVTSGARRGCGIRQPGGAYLAVPLGPGGQPIEAFLIDPPILMDPDALGLSAVGVTMIDRDGITHVLDIVGREHYPTVAEFIDEARRLGVSRRIAKTSDISRITPASRLIVLHAHADIANAPDYTSDRACPCHVREHQADTFADMCARLWWEEPLAARHRLAAFASFPIPQIEVVRDPAGGTHTDTVEVASKAGVPIVEVDQ